MHENYFNYIGCFFNHWEIYLDQSDKLVGNFYVGNKCFGECQKTDYVYSISGPK